MIQARQYLDAFALASNNDIGNIAEQLEQLHSDMWTTTQQLLDIDRDMDDETETL